MGLSPSAALDGSHLKLWITDFGLARMEQDAGMTMTGDLLGTLRYMSPEQALAKRVVVDHRSDIYSLGVTLYELVTLEPAFPATDRQELLRQIAFEEPRKPRQINSRIPHDLETIILKAIEKNPADRYATALLLGDDLRRFLDNKPIEARRASFVQRSQKWARRHAALVSVAAVVLLLAVAGLAVSTALVQRQSVRAQENLDLALSSLERTLAESVAGDLIVEMREPKRAELERQGILFFEKFARNNNVDPQTWPTYRMLLCNERHSKAKALHTSGNLEAAEAAYKDAIVQAKALFDSFADNPRHQARLAYCLANYAQLLGQTTRMRQAADHYVAAEAIASKLVQQSPGLAEYENILGQVLYNHGTTYALGGELARAESAFRAAVPPLELAISHDPGNEYYRYVLAQCRYNLGQALGIMGSRDEARRVWEQALADWRSLAQEHPRTSEYLSRVGATLSNLAVLACDNANFGEARALAEQALDAQKRARAIKPPYQHCDPFLATHYKVLSQSLAELDDEKALAAISEERIKLLPNFCSEYCGASRSLAVCAELLHSSHATAEDFQRRADAHCGHAQQILANARAKFNSEEDYVSIAQAYMDVGNSFNNARRRESARQAWGIARKMFAEFPNNEMLFDPASIVEQIQDLDETLKQNMNTTKPPDSDSNTS